MSPDDPATIPSEEGPPLLRSWRRVYTVVILNLLVLIFLLFLFSRAFA